VPIFRGNSQEAVLTKARALADDLRAAGIRVMLDDRDAYTPGWKYAEWEMRGVPVRLEIGPRDIQNNQAIAVRRDTREKASVSLDGLAGTLQTLLDTVQSGLLARAVAFRESHTTHVETYAEFKEAMEGRPGFVVAPWAYDAALEAQIKAETQATLRNVPFIAPKPEGKPCMLSGKPADVYAYFAKAY
jgi:prolyl-tRNA synthetase